MSGFAQAYMGLNRSCLDLFGEEVIVCVGNTETTLTAILMTGRDDASIGVMDFRDGTERFDFDTDAFSATGADAGDLIEWSGNRYTIVGELEPDDAGMTRVTVRRFGR